MTDFTKTVISMALEDLLSKKPLSELTVKEITDRAGVNRQTFYYHFKNIEDLVTWTIEKDIELFRKECEEHGLEWEDRLLYLSDVLKKSRGVILNAYNSVDGRTFHRYVNMLTLPMVEALKRRNAYSSDLTEDEEKAVSVFFSNLFGGYFISWLEEGSVNDGKLISKLIDYIALSLDAIITSTRSRNN